MKKILTLALVMLGITACMKKVEVPATVTVDDINAILESKKLDLDLLGAYLPVFVDQYSSDVENFLKNPTKEKAQEMSGINKSVDDAVCTLEGIKELVDDDFKLDLTRHIKRLQRENENCETKVKELISAKRDKHESSHRHSSRYSSSVDPNSYSYVKITGNGVRLRYGPGLGYEVYTQLNKGARVQRAFVDDSDWYGVYYAGNLLYVSRDFASLSR